MTNIFKPMFLFAAAAVFTAFAGDAPGAPPPQNAYVVEESWKLELATPATGDNAPQFQTGFRIDGSHVFVTTFNFRDQPEYSPGDIQFQVWDGETCTATLDVIVGALNTSNDTITWKHVYRLAGGNLDNRIVGLNSQTWGQNINTTGLSIASPGLSTFNQYDVTNSITESGIGYGSNRVTWFGITQVRIYDDHGKKLQEDTTLRPVYPAP